ncbi:MAG: TolC family protein, partial [Methylomonas sp.]|nr:TolC family protein [Methylomonas sp.]
MASTSQSLLGILTATLLLTGGCAIKRGEYNVPLAPMPQQFKNEATFTGHQDTETASSDGSTNAGLQLGTLLNEWWYFLENEELNHLIDQAMANNTDLRIAMLRISQSYARSEQAFAGQFPELSVVGQGHHDSPSNGVNSFSGFGNKKDRQYAQIGPRADWRVDIWGELKSLSEAAELEAWGASYQRDDVRRQLIANVVSRYIEYLSLNDRIQVAFETKTALENLLNSVNERLKLGDATIIELEQQRAAVMAVEATIPNLELQREITENALTQLLGVTPGSLTLSDQGIDALKLPDIKPIAPSNLLLRRPDVRAVEAQLLAADADIDVARARVLPPLDITAQAGWGILALGGLTTPYGPLFNLAGNLSATIFDYGKRLEEVAYSRARHEELVENYIRVIYQAVRETEDALANIHLTGKQLDAQQIATEAALKAWESSQISYEFGDLDFLTLLDTERTYHRNLDEYHRVRNERYQGLVAVFSALGGGVPPGDSLPGEGQRPPEESGHVTAAFAAPASGILWEEAEESEEFWLVQLAGLQDPAGVVHVWRDLQQRFPELMKDRSLMPREEGRIENDEQERIRWYRVFVARFQDQPSAEDFCRNLEAQL